MTVGVVKDYTCYNVSAHSTSATEVCLLGNIHVGDILVFAEEWEVENDLKGLGVGSEDDQVSNSTVE